MNKEQDRLNSLLDKEVSQLHFSGHKEVLKRTHPKTVKEKLSIWWNKEIEIPLRLIGAILICFLLIGSYSFYENMRNDNEINHDVDRVLVEEGGNVYWKDDLERAVGQNEG